MFHIDYQPIALILLLVFISIASNRGEWLYTLSLKKNWGISPSRDLRSSRWSIRTHRWFGTFPNNTQHELSTNDHKYSDPLTTKKKTNSKPYSNNPAVYFQYKVFRYHCEEFVCMHLFNGLPMSPKIPEMWWRTKKPSLRNKSISAILQSQRLESANRDGKECGHRMCWQ